MSSDTASSSRSLSRAPQRQRGRDRVYKLLEAATVLFLEKGFAATTMTEIAARAGASIGSLYLFVPTKEALAQEMVTTLADDLSSRLDGLRCRAAGKSASWVADALFGELAQFLAQHPVYAALIDVPGDDGWKATVRARRRAQIAALFSGVEPSLPAGQPDRLAVIVPHLIRITIVPGTEATSRDDILNELRTMLRRHLDQPAIQA